MRHEPEDPNELVVNWAWHQHFVTVWEDPDEVLPWTLRWEVFPSIDDGDTPPWQHEETFRYAAEALVRAGVIAHSVEFDQRLIQADVNVSSDRSAFEQLVVKLLAFATASRVSTDLTHHVRR